LLQIFLIIHDIFISFIEDSIVKTKVTAFCSRSQNIMSLIEYYDGIPNK
jgi:hypothetical protein